MEITYIETIATSQSTLLINKKQPGTLENKKKNRLPQSVVHEQ